MSTQLNTEARRLREKPLDLGLLMGLVYCPTEKPACVCLCVCSLLQPCVLEWAASVIPMTSPASLIFWNTVSNINHRGSKFSQHRKFPSLSCQRLILP